jgi:outer membrane immunogenic protein
MKKILLAGITAAAFCCAPALAADMAVKAPPAPAPPPAPVYSWTGCYIGGNVGGGWGSDGTWQDTAGLSHGGQNFGGVIGGGQVGCDYQVSAWVVGVAGMFDWSNLTGSGADPYNTFFASHTRVTMLDTATARLGYTFDHSLFYVDGGAAWSTTERYFTPSSPADCAPATCVTATNTATGWTIGGGWEYLFSSNLSGKIEYDYAGFGSATVNPALGSANSPYAIKQNISTVLVGLNYRFNGVPGH